MAITLIEPYIVNSSANFTFAGVNATSNLTVVGVSNLGPVGNVIITGGSNGQVLTTNGSGNLSWTTVTGGGGANISNGNSNVNIATANGNITMSVAGNANVATVTGTGVNVSGTLNTTGNITAANANLGNAATANFFIGNGSLLTGLPVSTSLANGNSNVNIPAANGNVNISAAGNANILVVTGTGANVSGTANVTGNIVGGGNLNIAGNAVIGGNLTVDGDLVYVNVTDLSVEDPIIQLQRGPNGAAPSSNTGKDVGTALNYYDTSAKIAWMGWDVSNAEIAFGSNVGISSEVVTFTSLANIRSGNAQLGNLATANFISGTLTTASQPNITSIGILSSLSVTGNISAGNANLGNAATANFFVGDGSLLTGLPAGTNISNGNSNVNIPTANGNINLSASGNANILVVTGTGVNVAGTGNFAGNLAASNLTVGSGSGGNITGVNVFLANTANFSTALNVTGVSNLGPVGNVIITGGSDGQVLTTNGSGNLSWTSISTSGVSNGNSNLSIPAANGNVNISAAGNANIFVVTGTGVNVTGTLNVSGNLTAGNANLGNAASANFFIGDGSLLTGLPGSTSVANGNSNVNIPAANGNVVISVAGNSNVFTVTGTGANVAGTFDITSNLTVGGKSNLGAVGNVIITGGSANYILQTDGSGNLSWAAFPILTSTVDNFTGNGVQTTFTLSVTPTSKNYTTVSYNGALLIRDSYSLSGANIVFTAAPANGANIEVTTLSGTGTTIGGSSTQVQYNNNGQLAGSSTFTFDAGNTRLTANNLAVSNIFTANRVGSDLIPNANITYDLGTSTNRWRDIWLSNSTIHLGNVSISATEGTVVLPEGTKVGNTSVPLTTVDLLDVNSNISPEVFTINVDFPNAGHGDDWFWTWNAGTVSYSRLKITNQVQATVPLYKSGTYTVNNFAAHELHGNMTQTHKIYLKWINGAGLENLVPWANSTLNVAGVSHPDINGGANTEVQRLIINVPQNITLPVLTPPNVSYNVSFTTSGAYTFTGTQMGNNPNIGPLYRGGTYTFNLANSLSGHPFYLTTDNGGNFVSNTFVGEYTNGVTGSRNQSGTLTFTVPNNAPNTLFYQCGIHSHMRGQITIKDLAVETNNDGNLILYFQHTQEGHFTPVEIRNKPTLDTVSSACLIFDGVTKKFEIKDMGQYIDETTQFRTKVENLIASETSDKPTNAQVTAKIRDETLFSSTLHQRGNLEVLTGTARWYAPFNLQITNIIPRLATASNGNVAVAINKNGSSTRTFTFAPNATTANLANSIINMTSGDYLTVDVTSVGNVAPGQDMYVQFTYKKV